MFEVSIVPATYKPGPRGDNSKPATLEDLAGLGGWSHLGGGGGQGWVGHYILWSGQILPKTGQLWFDTILMAGVFSTKEQTSQQTNQTRL